MKKSLMLVLLLGLVSLGALAGDMSSKPMKGTWTGWVSDMKCGAAKHDAACVKKCLDAGEKMAFVNDKDKSVIPVANPDSLKGHEGHHIKVKGTIDNGQLTVQSASMLKDQGMASGSSSDMK